MYSRFPFVKVVFASGAKTIDHYFANIFVTISNFKRKNHVRNVTQEDLFLLIYKSKKRLIVLAAPEAKKYVTNANRIFNIKKSFSLKITELRK